MHRELTPSFQIVTIPISLEEISSNDEKIVKELLIKYPYVIYDDEGNLIGTRVLPYYCDEPSSMCKSYYYLRDGRVVLDQYDYLKPSCCIV